MALVVVFVLLAAQALLELALPTYTSNIVDVGIAQCVDAQGNLQLDYIIQMAGLMMLTTLGVFLTNLLADLVSSRTGAKIGRDLRCALFEKITEFSKTEIDKFSSATLITRGTNDIQNIQMACVLTQRMVLYSPIMAIGGVVAVSQSNLSMVWIIVLGVVVVAFVVVALMGITMPKFKMMQKLIDRVNLIAREILNGLPVVRAFGREKYEEDRFDVASQNLRDTQLFTNRVMTFMMPVMTLVMNLMSVLIVWVGGHAISAGTLQTGEMIAYITYSMIIVASFLMLGMVAVVLPRANVAANRVWDVITCEVSIKDGNAEGSVVSGRATSWGLRERAIQDRSTHSQAGPTAHNSTNTNELHPPRHSEQFSRPARKCEESHAVAVTCATPFVEFDNVSFKYVGAEKEVLSGVSFTAMAGETTAIVGATGCGKSTVVQLVERFYDATSGTVRVCGQDVRSMRLHDLRAKFGYVPQKAFLFTGTVESNVMYGAECGGSAEKGELQDGRAQSGGESAEQVLNKALEIAQADEFVKSLAEGTNAPISQGGTNVSGGQRQRLGIARAIASGLSANDGGDSSACASDKEQPNASPKAYLFDDSFSALDYKTDAALRTQMSKHLKGATVIIVAQRVATVMHANKIICLANGKVAGSGTHAQLLEMCPEYYDIAASQLSTEELRASMEEPPANTAEKPHAGTPENPRSTANPQAKAGEAHA